MMRKLRTDKVSPIALNEATKSHAVPRVRKEVSLTSSVGQKTKHREIIEGER